jgi:4-amino-4-deoxy-L-arabinose transferase-like glycosyltransferase
MKMPIFSLDSKKNQNLTALALILFFLIINVLSVQEKSWTYDEPNHYRYGQNILNGNSDRFDDSKMPVSAWNALPARIASFLPDGVLKVYLKKEITARLMTTLFSMLVAFMVFHWSRKLYGVVPAFVSLILYVLDPNIIAHSQLVTTDVYIMGMMLFSCYWLWKFANSRKWRDFWMFALMLSLAQLTKYTAVSMYPLLLAALVLHDLPGWLKSVHNGDRREVLKEAGKYILYIGIVAMVSLAVINAGFLFNRSFTPFNDYAFRSELFKSIKLNVVVPTPYPFLEGFDWIVYKERTGAGYGRIYMLGQSREGGFDGYYFVATLLKMPIATQLTLLIAFAVYLWRKQYKQTLWRDDIFLFLPVLFYTIYFNFFYNAQIGIRYYIIVFPLLYVFAGSLFVKWNEFSFRQRMSAYALGLYLLVSVLSYYPNYLGYFNEIVWKRLDAYKYLADSNLDWGQDYYALKQYQAEHPDVKKAPEHPDPIKDTKIYFVPVNQLVGVLRAPEAYEWLRQNFEPFDRIGTSYLLYRITPQEMNKLCGSTPYCQ